MNWYNGPIGSTAAVTAPRAPEPQPEDGEPYFNQTRKLNWVWLFGVEFAATMGILAFLMNVTFVDAIAPPTEVGRLLWLCKRLWIVAFPSFSYLWGAMRTFDKSTLCEDPFAGVETMRLRTFQKILTNNVEQTVLFVPAISSFALTVEAAAWPAVPTLLYTWVAGRFLFGAGYFVPALPGNRFAPLFTLRGWARSPGMNLTLYPTTFAIVGCLYAAITADCDAPELDEAKKKFMGLF